MLIVNVWKSEEAFRRFFENGARAAQQAGLEVPQFEPRVARVHNHLPEGGGPIPR